ncbi:hypothetical protein [Acetivibrio cellulolyticus]|uniref:hypothetical protein n=1 Tax=Acetivibrio cellulolyticus TaxID=35830 RepID=UPI0001E2E26E|nr:hypothetical protein [Acetivibrio cellulolyticus]
MSDSGNKKFGELIGDKMLQMKLNAAMDMLKKGNVDDLAKKINKMDKNDLIDKIDEIDESKLNDLNLNIDKDDMKKLIGQVDLNNLSQLLGDRGDELVDKFKKMLESNK